MDSESRRRRKRKKMKGKNRELDVKRKARKKRIIRFPKRHLPLPSFYSSKSGSGKSTRSVSKKKKDQRSKSKDALNHPDKEQRLPKTDEDDTNHEEAAVVENMEINPTPNPAVKRWVRLILEKKPVDSNKFVGLQCKIYWPLDDAWYSARLKEYNTETGYHHVLYDDGDEEDVLLRREKIQFLISEEELQQLTNFSPSNTKELGPGDVIWAKLTGHSAWPALVLEEELVAGCKGLRKAKDGQKKSYPVQFFGTHDLARVKKTETTPFYTGFVSCLHHKCKKPAFIRGLEEAKLYLTEEKLPEKMLLMQNDSTEAEISEGSVD